MRFSEIKLYKKLAVFAIASTVIVSCGSSKNVTSSKKSPSKTVVKSENLRKLDSSFDGKVSGSIKSLLKDAESYLGTPYKFGGNTSSGFDCSGFTVKVFQENNFNLPRRSSDQADSGKSIDIKNSKTGRSTVFCNFRRKSRFTRRNCLYY
ncbi:C40 family peptidase [Chryseobacterium indoltheticum]|uniref:C40 family peptidase n=1 Tax=Chryseobacterium indoltheticum TaxID=254 RepID=UPI003F49AD3F